MIDLTAIAKLTANYTPSYARMVWKLIRTNQFDTGTLNRLFSDFIKHNTFIFMAKGNFIANMHVGSVGANLPVYNGDVYDSEFACESTRASEVRHYGKERVLTTANINWRSTCTRTRLSLRIVETKNYEPTEFFSESVAAGFSY